MQRKVVIFGGGGQLGVELCREFQRRGWLVQPFDRKTLNIADQSLIEAAIAKAAGGVGQSCKGCHDNYRAK